MSDQQPQPIEIQDAQDLSDEGKLVVQMFADMRSKQLDFLDASGKSLIERITTFLAILFAITAFSSNFPPPYLRGNLPAKIMVVITLLLFLTSMGEAILVIQPRLYDIPLHNVTRMSEALKKITAYKMRHLRIAGSLFTLASTALAILIISVIWAV